VIDPKQQEHGISQSAERDSRAARRIRECSIDPKKKRGCSPKLDLDKCLLLLVRSDKDIPRACKEAGEFLAFRDARFPTIHEEHDEEFVGIWVDPLVVDLPPELLGRTSANGHRAFRSRGSFGSSGVWLLSWLDAAHGSTSADLGALRESLVLALVEQQTLHDFPTTPQFAPIFNAADGWSHICFQTERLRILFAEVIGEPLAWNRTTGSLRRVDKFEHAEASSEVDD
jgi:hypothetical protein